jgi:hypothetical protein
MCYTFDQINEDDEKALEAFMSDQPRRLLGDILAEKKQAEQQQGSCKRHVTDH